MAALSPRQSDDKLQISGETHMNKICDICGDIGVVDAIITCSQCRIADEHIYCMQSYCGDVLTVWICEECKLSNEMILPKSGVNSSGMVPHDTKGSAGLNKLPNGSGRSNFRWEKKVQKGKTKYIPAQEAIRLSSGATKNLESSSRANFVSRPGSSKPTASTSGRTPIKPEAYIKPKAMLQMISSQIVKENTTFGSSRHLKSPRRGDSQINLMVQPQMVQASKEVKENNSVIAPMKEHAHMEKPKEALKPAEEIETTNTKVEKATGKVLSESSPSMHCPPTIISGGNVCNDVKQGNFDAESGELVNFVPEVEKPFLSDPAVNACWKGSFKLPDSIKRGEINEKYWAHSPLKVHRKAYEFSKQMPEVLEFELLPRDILWTDICQEECPDRDDIGLYFFPSNSERSESNISLLEFLSTRDLVMRNYRKGVELLVLASKVLHTDSQRWNGNYFLWGVFRRVKIDGARPKDKEKCTVLYHPSIGADDGHGKDSEAIDMDIDMIGGKDVGRADIVISKEPLWRGNGSPRAETVAAITLHGSDAKFPKNSDFTCQDPPLDVYREMYSDIPPGFEQIYKLRFKDDSCRATVTETKPLLVDGKIINLKENTSLERASAVRGTSSSGTPKRKYSDLPGQLDKHHQTMGTSTAFSSPQSVKNTVFGVTVKSNRPDDKRCSETGKKGSTGSPDNYSSSQDIRLKIKTEVL